MSNYRDDSISTAIVSDSTWTNTSGLITEIAAFTVSTLFGLMVMTTDSAVASDSTELSGRGLMAIETAQVTDELFLQRNSTIDLIDQINVSDQYQFNFTYLVEEVAVATAYDVGLMRLNHTVSAKATDLDFSQRVSHSLVVETALALDQGFGQQTLNLEETAQVIDESFHRAHAYIMCESFALAIDYDLSSSTADQITTDSASAYSETFGTLNAKNFDISYASVEDSALGNHITGQTWTAHADTMAMSRYAPFDFEGMSVIAGRLYAWNDEGVYLVGVEGEHIEGHLVTGKLDFGESLTHPTAAYLEYQLSGSNRKIDLSITTTQSGQPKQYNYILASEQADHLTNGRIIFGRGLRGRHFTFDLKIKGTSSQIYSLSFEHVKTARRT